MKSEKDFKEKAKEIINDVEDKTDEFSEEEKENGKGMAVLSYIIPLVPYLVEKDNKYVIFHAKQGMNLFIVELVYAVINVMLTSLIRVRRNYNLLGYDSYLYYTTTPWWVVLPLSLIGLGIFAIAVIGIINAINGKAKELPLINKIKIFK